MGLLCQQEVPPLVPALQFCQRTCMSSCMLQVPIGNLDQYLDELIRDQKQRMQVILPADLSWPICMALQSPMMRMQAKCLMFSVLRHRANVCFVGTEASGMLKFNLPPQPRCTVVCVINALF